MTTNSKTSQFEKGAVVGASTSLILVGVLYILLAPTDDIRARIPFLFEASGGFVGVLCMVVFSFVGAGALLVQRALSRPSLGGVIVASFSSLLLILTGGIPRVLPEFDSLRKSVAVFAAWVALGLILTRIAWIVAFARKT